MTLPLDFYDPGGEDVARTFYENARDLVVAAIRRTQLGEEIMAPLSQYAFSSEAEIQQLVKSTIGIPIKFGRDGVTIDKVASCDLRPCNGGRVIVATTAGGMVMEVLRVPAEIVPPPLQYEIGEGFKYEVVQCDVPPLGWVCSRTKGHRGPCAARMTVTEQELQRWKAAKVRCKRNEWIFLILAAVIAVVIFVLLAGFLHRP